MLEAVAHAATQSGRFRSRPKSGVTRSLPRAKPSLTVAIPGATLRHDNDMYI